MTTVILRLAGAECVLRGDSIPALAAGLRLTGDVSTGDVRDAASRLTRRLTDARDGATVEIGTEPERAALDRALLELERHAPLSGELSVLLRVVGDLG